MAQPSNERLNMNEYSLVRGRKTRKIAGVSAAFVLLLATSALAYFILYANGSGTGSGTLGKATVTTTEVTPRTPARRWGRFGK